MSFLKKSFNSKEVENEPKIIVTGIRSVLYDINGNIIPDEEATKMQAQWKEESAKRQIEQEKQGKERQKKIDALKDDQIEPTDWFKNYLALCQKNCENVSYEMISQSYFELLNDQREAGKNKDYKKAYMYAQEALSLLAKFIEGEYNRYGTFAIQTIPAVEFCMKYDSIMGLVGGFKNIRDIVNYIPELKYLYYEQLFEYEILLELSKKIRKLVKTNNDILQNTLKKVLPDYEPKLITKSCSWMEKFGLLKREKIKNTYKLNLTY